ncbi:MAG: hypothetical protein RLZZ308_280 [Candidatus Parcubacteria bacterium]|jgi:bifunctional phosphoglucose/phosphomannose isomerase
MEPTLQPLYTIKEQTLLRPAIVSLSHKKTYTSYVVVGMGGSATSVLLLKMFFPSLPITLHNGYGLPLHLATDSTLIILNSYSGNTEEVLDAYTRGSTLHIDMVMVSCGGELITLAENNAVPHIVLPHNGLEPRFAIIHQMIAILTLMDEHDKIEELTEYVNRINLQTADTQGKILAEMMHNKYIVLHTTQTLYPIAHAIQAAITEGAKTPSFVSIIPEANHNELHGFVRDDTHDEHEHFAFLLLNSLYDHQRIHKRYTVMEELYKERSFSITSLTSDHTNPQEVLQLLLSGYFMATHLALQSGTEPYATPFIQRFKAKMIES